MKRARNFLYIDDEAEIWFKDVPPGILPLRIPEGVTLASGRGRNGSQGALLHSDVERKEPFFEVVGRNVRITGLRIRSPRLAGRLPERFYSALRTFRATTQRGSPTLGHSVP